MVQEQQCLRAQGRCRVKVVPPSSYQGTFYSLVRIRV